jgi:L-ascorbate metabolism protein UlaG (beta-lactamase superfamily)
MSSNRMGFKKVIILLLILLMINSCAKEEAQAEGGDTMQENVLELDGLVIEWLGHAGFKLKGEKVIYIDPYESSADEKADIILVTHAHHDHCSIADIQRLSTTDTVIVGTPACQSKLPAERVSMKEFKIIKPGVELEVLGISIEAVPSYNLDKQFHPKTDENVGYVVDMNGKRVYHAGDTDKVPEMANIKNIDVALLPVGGTYTMDAKEAAEACDIIKPSIAVPMHYGKIVGSSQDAQSFKSLCKQEVKILG